MEYARYVFHAGHVIENDHHVARVLCLNGHGCATSTIDDSLDLGALRASNAT
jgi:hypothetical protein